MASQVNDSELKESELGFVCAGVVCHWFFHIKSEGPESLPFVYNQ